MTKSTESCTLNQSETLASYSKVSYFANWIAIGIEEAKC